MMERRITLVLILLVFLVTVYRMAASILSQNTTPLSNTAPFHDEYSAADIALAKEHDTDDTERKTVLFEPPLVVSGRYIVDARKKRIKLASVNWYGASDCFSIPSGLDVQHRAKIANRIRRLGFNSVRLPYSDQMVRDNPLIDSDLLAANPDLAGSRALTVFAAVVRTLADEGLAVIMNNHITQSRWCCDGNLCDAAWANSYLGPLCSVSQTTSQWIEHWETIMSPHVDEPFVVGADLRNEPRGLFGAFGWDAWASAAEQLSERLLSIQPSWLMIVEGTSSSNDLSRVRNRPIVLSVPNRVVYSAHVYGWSGWGSLSPYWSRKYVSFAQDMDRNWGYLLSSGTAPVWISEIGAPAKPNQGDMHYWTHLTRYLERADADFAYWAINPHKPAANEAESYALLQDDWETPVWDYRMYDMARLMRNTTS